MKRIQSLFVRTRVFIGLCVAAACALTWETTPTAAPTVQPAAPTETAPSASSAGPIVAPGQITYKDPFTGKLGPRPANVPPLELNAEQLRAFSTSSEGLREVRSPVDQNAILLRLQGRFHFGMAAHLDAEHHLNTVCVTDMAQPASH